MKDSTPRTPTAPSIAQVLVGDVRVVVFSRTSSDEEFDAHLREAVAMDRQVRAVLVLGDENAPLSAKARARLRDSGLLSKRTAVLADSLVVRSVITALNWMGADVRGFRPDHFDQACAFLEIPSPRRPGIQEQLNALRQKVRLR